MDPGLGRGYPIPVCENFVKDVNRLKEIGQNSRGSEKVAFLQESNNNMLESWSQCPTAEIFQTCCSSEFSPSNSVVW